MPLFSTHVMRDLAAVDHQLGHVNPMGDGVGQLPLVKVSYSSMYHLYL